MTDVAQQISAVRRRVGSRTLAEEEARVVTVSRVYDTDVEDLWDACTNPERIPRWFLPVSGELRLGGRFQLENHAGGTIESCDPPKSFSSTWEYDGEVSWIEVRVTAESGGARFELDHICPVNDHWRRYGPGAAGIGWDFSLQGLTLHLAAGGAQVDSDEFQAWMVSDDGKQFVALASESWYEAMVAAGGDQAEAREQADRCTAFYRGEEEPA